MRRVAPADRRGRAAEARPLALGAHADAWAAFAIAAGTIVGFAAIVTQSDSLDRWSASRRAWAPVVLAALAMFVVGVLDDRLQLSPVAKLVASLAIGAFLVFALAGAEPEGALPSWYTLLATVWFAGICHALNLLDNMDGLAAGVGFIAAIVPGRACFGALARAGARHAAHRARGRAARISSTGTACRARLFMGDCGSLFIGALLAAASLVPVFNARLAFINPAVIVVLILVVPLFDTGFVLVLRRLAGRKATKGGTDHVSHRLVSLGFSERSAVRILYLLGLVGGAHGVAADRGQRGSSRCCRSSRCSACSSCCWGSILARVPAYNAEDFVALQKSSFAPLLKDLAFRWHAGEVMLDLVLITVCYYMAYRLRFDGEDLDNFLPYFTASLPVVLGCKLAALYSSRLYQRSWETFGLRDVAAVVRGVGMGSLLSVLTAAYLYRLEGFSRAVFVLDAMLLGDGHRRDARVVPGHEPRGGDARTSAAGACSSTGPARSARRWCARCAPTRSGT